MTSLQKAYFLDLLLVDSDHGSSTLTKINSDTLSALDSALNLSRSGNVEIELNWFLLVVKHKYEPAYPALKRFLGQHGRMKYNRPLYQYQLMTVFIHVCLYVGLY
jgi:hypothetical protein